MDQPKAIKNLEELMAAVRIRAFLFGHNEKFTLEVGEASPELRECWQSRFDKNYSECGCGVGQWFVLGAIIVAICSVSVQVGGFHSVDGKGLLRWLGFVAIAALVGKVVGLIIAYIALRKLAKEIAQNCSDHYR